MKIVFLDSYSLGHTDLSGIKSLGEFIEYADTPSSLVVERSQGADVIITNKVKVMASEIDQLPDLKLICVAATGVNNVDVDYASSKGIEVRNVPAYSTESVAEATFAMVLGLLRNVVYYDHYVKSGVYSNSSRCFNLDMPISEIKGKKWGIIAMGNIGRRVAELAKVFGAEVIYYSTSGKNMGVAGYESVSLDVLLRESDIITIHAPLNDSTRGLIAMPQFEMMKSSAIVVNLGRGGIIVEKDLAEALNSEKICAAALDVFVNEPLEVDSPILSVQNPDKLILAPHCGWASAEAREVLVEVLVKNILTFFA